MLSFVFLRGTFSEPSLAPEVFIELFGKGTKGQTKGCPKGAFLGLCEEGLIKEVNPGIYTKSKLNKLYELEAVEILISTPSLVSTPDMLWQRVQNGRKRTHNYQMNVVIALWSNDLIHH